MESLTPFRKTARKHARRTDVARRRRRERAWDIARTAAALLKSHYHATRVTAFGSLTRADGFHLWSDVDLTAWGLAPTDYFEAVARVLDVGGDIKVDLIRAERCRPYMRAAIKLGVDL